MTWKVFAQRRLKRERNIIGGNLFFSFGSLGRARQGAGDGISEVALEVDKELGTYWGWLPRGGAHPIYISDSEEEVGSLFSGGDFTSRIEDAVRAGRGQVLQLSVKQIREVEW
jgi:hypothetical protein